MHVIMEKKLFLLDAYALIYRAYYTFINNPRRNSTGKNTSAAYGFTNTLYEVLEKRQPTHIAVVFDPETPTFRHDMYKEYKAQRPPTPEDLKSNIPDIKRIIEGFNIPVVSVDYYEADDVIGTLAQQAARKGFTVYMMTPDKDYCQLVDEGIYMYKPKRSGNDAELWDVETVKQRFKVKQPSQVVDVLALWGDNADNIPGVPGVGEKTAVKLVSQFGSLEDLYARTHELKGKQKQKIEENKEAAFLAKKLVTIATDAPVEFDEEAYKLAKPDQDKLHEVFEELEFRSVERRIMGGQSSSQPSQGSLFGSEMQQQAPPEQYYSITDTPHDYQLVDTPQELEKFTDAIKGQHAFCFDTETTSLNPHDTGLVGVAFSFKKGTAYYIPVDQGKIARDTLMQTFKELFADENKTAVGHNIKFDIEVLAGYGIPVHSRLFDTMLAHYLLHPELQHNMDFVAKQYLNYDPVPIEELIGKKGKKQASMRSVPVKDAVEYAGEDADITWQLKEKLEPALKENQLEDLFYRIEILLIPVLVDMEQFGVKINEEALYQYMDELRNTLVNKEQEIYKQAGREFNISSTKQLGEVLFDYMQIVSKPKKTKTGQYATSEQELQKIADKHPIVPLILEHRSLKKLLNTYVQPLPKLISKKTGKIHTSFNQAVAATGRLSSTNPNLQNIPIRAPEGRRIRRAFVPSAPERVLLAADYSQIELRLIAHLSGDQQMLEAFRNDLDIHAATAAKIHGVPLDQVTRDMRSKAKSANFGIVYGISAFGLSQNLRIPRKEAKDLIDGYFATYPEVKTYMDNNITRAREYGYVTTIFGRRRYLPDINSRNAVVRGIAERNAINAPIQGSAADIIKLAMIEVFAELKKQKLLAHMTLQVHDELILDVPRDELETVKDLVVRIMQGVTRLEVPLTVEAGHGNNWLEAH